MLSVEDGGGSSTVRNMTCARDDDYFGRQHTKKMLLVHLSHVREKFAVVLRVQFISSLSLTRESPFL